jgi:hypothetical protein
MPYLFHQGSRYWVHAANVVVILAAIVQTFWTFLSYQNVEWTYARFVAMLTIPGILYFIASMLVPDDPKLMASWQKHYYDRRIQYFSAITCWGVLTLINTTFVLGMAFNHPARGVQLTMVGMGLCGLISDRPVVHKLLVGVGLAAIVAIGLIVLLVAAVP